MGVDAEAVAGAHPLGALGVERFAVAARLSRWLAAEGLLVVILGVFTCLWAIAAPSLFQADSWLTLLAGREIAANGIPREDTFAVMTDGRPWIDQQWLAQLGFYGVASLGGLKLAALAAIGLLFAPLALAFAFARRREASVRAIAVVAIPGALYFTSFLRAQLVSHLLFVALVALLSSESRAPSRRVVLAFPLLLLWANVHGAVLLGAALTALLGVCELIRIRRSGGGAAGLTRPLALVLAPWLCVVATPYGLSIADYYRATVGNPVFPQALTEWMPPTLLTLTGLPFFVLAGLAIALVARARDRLTGLELGVLAVTLLGGLLAVRSIVWFAFAALMLVPALFEREGKRPVPAALVRFRVVGATATAVLAAGALAYTAARPEEEFARKWPQAVPAQVAGVLRADPEARVLASYEFGDWLLYARPEVRGRIAFDGRWELFSAREMRSILDYLWQVGEDWEAPSRGYRVLVLNPRTQPGLVETYEARPGVRVLYRDSRFAVFERAS
jgi:hypothetical protein